MKVNTDFVVTGFKIVGVVENQSGSHAITGIQMQISSDNGACLSSSSLAAALDCASTACTVAVAADGSFEFRNLQSVQPVLSALKKIGFDDVFEVARGADIVSRAIAQKLREPNLPRPLISSACPAVVRLIQVRFPDLIPHIVDVRQPMEVAAMIARTGTDFMNLQLSRSPASSATMNLIAAVPGTYRPYPAMRSARPEPSPAAAAPHHGPSRNAESSTTASPAWM